MIEKNALKAVEFIRSKTHFVPRLGLILGSGLGGISEKIQPDKIFSYEEIPGFSKSTIPGHSGRLHLGYLENFPVACLQGRIHLYEGGSQDAIVTLVRTLKLLGCDTLLITNAAGSIRPNMPTGSLMAITDHINFQFNNPLVGENDERFGPRFFSMDNAYDAHLRHELSAVAKKTGISLFQGVYVGVLGPCFETPAEIRAFHILGADAVGMSTVPEVIAGRHCGLKILAISVITNMAAGMSAEKLDHEQTLRAAAATTADLAQLIYEFIKNLGASEV